jgi:hypothetical protein
VTPDGPILPVWIGVSEQQELYLRGSHRPVPPRIEVWALIDTGAFDTCVSQSLLSRLGVESKGKYPLLSTTSGNQPQICDIFSISVSVPLPPVSLTRPLDTEFRISTLDVVAVDLEGMAMGALIGRDVLQRSLFVYDGRTGQFMISF